ncbi:MAG: hypothetical protein V4617_00235 [Gemmatimonadota bacterium]
MRHAIFVAALFMVSACAKQPANTAPVRGTSAPPASSSSTIGASSSKGAVEAFLSAVKAADLQAMSSVWGNREGLARDKYGREELEKRLIIIQCTMNHDRWNYAEAAPRLQTGGKQNWRVTLTRRNLTATINMLTVQGPGGRWLLEEAETAPLSGFCS